MYLVGLLVLFLNLMVLRLTHDLINIYAPTNPTERKVFFARVFFAF